MIITEVVLAVKIICSNSYVVQSMYLLARYLHISCALMLIILWHAFSCLQQVYPSEGFLVQGNGCVDVSQQQRMHPLKWLFQDNLHSCAAGISKETNKSFFAVSNLAVGIAFKM